MRSLQDEICKAQHELSCPICSRSFSLPDIRLRTFDDKAAAELSVVCSRGHFPVILIVPITLVEIRKAGSVKKAELRRATKKIGALENSIEELLID